jgi:hypothetical protein
VGDSEYPEAYFELVEGGCWDAEDLSGTADFILSVLDSAPNWWERDGWEVYLENMTEEYLSEIA